MVARFKSKKALITTVLLLAIIGTGLAVFLTWQKNNGDTDTSQAVTQTSTEASEQSQTPEQAPQLTAPEPKLPDICSKVSDILKQVVGDGLKPSGSTATTDNNSKVTICNFSKDKQLVSVRIYEYSTESDAKADLSKVQLRGYAGQNEGKHNVVVSVVTDVTTNMPAATQIASQVVEKL